MPGQQGGEKAASSASLLKDYSKQSEFHFEDRNRQDTVPEAVTLLLGPFLEKSNLPQQFPVGEVSLNN